MDLTKMMLAMNKALPCWGDDLLGKLLAWASATGFMECTVQEPMHTVLMAAAQRFKIEGGEVPNIELMNKHYYPRLRELQRHKAKTPWLPELMERYQVVGWERYEYTWADDVLPRQPEEVKPADLVSGFGKALKKAGYITKGENE